MADLVRSLPAPQREYVVWQDPDKSVRKAPTPKSRAPPYGRRRGFVPRSIADFGDGGAFPEIHVAQYPLGMGTKEDKAAQQKGGVVALEVGEDGSVRYDAIVKQGANKNRIVQTSLKDTKGRAVGDDEGLELPTEEEVQETAQRTQQALSVILDGKVNLRNLHISRSSATPINKKLRSCGTRPIRTLRGIPLLLLSAS